MKKLAFSAVLFGILIALCASPAMANSTAGSGIKATKHDLSSKGGSANWGETAEQGGLDRICIYCHAPHHTLKAADAKGITYLPLWNHELSATATYKTYDAGTTGDDPNDVSHKLNAVINQPGDVSRLCLSCHDGTVGTNQYGFSPSLSKGGTVPKKLMNATQIGSGGDLSNHHPIGFNYADVKAVDLEIAAPTVLLGSSDIDSHLWKGNMECTTCHDVHNTKNAGEKFLWVSDNQSALCLTCHLKNP